MKGKKGSMSQRNPAGQRGITGNGKMQSGGGGTGKSSGSMGMGMSKRSGSSKGGY